MVLSYRSSNINRRGETVLPSQVSLIVFEKKRSRLDCVLMHLHWVIDPQREKTHLMTCVSNEDSNQPTHPHSLISPQCPHDETVLAIQAAHSEECERAGWSDSSLAVHVHRDVFWRCDSILIVIVHCFLIQSPDDLKAGKETVIRLRCLSRDLFFSGHMCPKYLCVWFLTQ